MSDLDVKKKNRRVARLEAASYDYDAIIGCGKGELFGEQGPRLPLPPMLMFSRITKISDEGGEFNKGIVEAELDIKDDLWFFPCHFHEDPVMPGCLGLDAMWQLLGFFLGWYGLRGTGRALGVGEVRFSGQIFPNTKLITYRVDIKRVLSSQLILGIGNGTLTADGKPIYTAKDLRIGLFENARMNQQE